jgi:hypothetical protein
MTAKFGFQVTVQDRTIWIFPEDIDAAKVAAQAEVLLKDTIVTQLAASGKAFDTAEKLDNFITTQLSKSDPVLAENIKKAINALPTTATIKDKVALLVGKVSLADIQTEINSLGDTVKSQINGLKARANAGIVYGWSRGTGEEPISLGVFTDLTKFIDNSIIAKLPSSVRPNFSVDQEFKALVSGLPEPVNSALTALTTKAVFELDSIRLKIPGKGSVDQAGKAEKTRFEIAMLINLLALDLELGPFQLNRIYAKLGNFDSVET